MVSRADPSDVVVSLHVVCRPESIDHWLAIEVDLMDCLIAHGVNHVTIAPEIITTDPLTTLPEYADGCRLDSPAA